MFKLFYLFHILYGFTMRENSYNWERDVSDHGLINNIFEPFTI